ncbi:MAG: Flp family type IVb pilin [Caulobacteraceae bacterium]|nr:Flp family type IVb pilin [Caulobacteraceae bacterium]
MFVKRYAQDRRGATAIEYSLICALIFLVIISSVTTFGTRATNTIAKIGVAVDGAIN